MAFALLDGFQLVFQPDGSAVYVLDDAPAPQTAPITATAPSSPTAPATAPATAPPLPRGIQQVILRPGLPDLFVVQPERTCKKSPNFRYDSTTETLYAPLATDDSVLIQRYDNALVDALFLDLGFPPWLSGLSPPSPK